MGFSESKGSRILMSPAANVDFGWGADLVALLSYWEETFSNKLSFSLSILLFHLLAIWIQGKSMTCFCSLIYISNILNVSDLFQRNAKYDLYECNLIIESLSWGIFSEYIMYYIKSWWNIDLDILLAQHSVSNQIQECALDSILKWLNIVSVVWHIAGNLMQFGWVSKSYNTF